MLPSILRALIEQNSVTISGLGTFMVIKLPSQIKDDIVYPPQNIISFEFSKDVEGFDFVVTLSQWKQIRIDEAQTEIDNWICMIEKGLVHDKSVFFDNFGTFSKDQNGKIVFHSGKNSEINIENEGLEPIYLAPKIINKTDQNNCKSVIDKRNILRIKDKKRDKAWFVVTIVAATLFLCGLFLKAIYNEFYYTIFENKEHNLVMEKVEPESTAFISNVLNNDFSEFDFSSNKDGEENFKHCPIEIVSNEDNIVNNENENLVEVNGSGIIHIPFEKYKFYVIAGSFAKEDDALQHIKQKKLEKYQAKIVVEPANPRYRVCIGVFDNEKDAISFAEQIDKNYWVLK
ncbi:MAG: SPOR domain-containing protein [Bacteroidales bacterium]|jgi:nucleoid DNA-binding protein|nr:SPOR domain-containing protein [Bacteroidales bacterium]